MSLLRDLLLLSGIAGLLSLGSFWLHPHRPALYLVEEKAEKGEITLKQVLPLVQAKQVLWVDARKRSEFDKNHIPEAILLNEYEWNELLPPAMEALQLGMEKKIVVYCDAMKCTASKTIASKIQDFFPEPENVMVLRGGWPAWQAELTK